MSTCHFLITFYTCLFVSLCCHLTCFLRSSFIAFSLSKAGLPIIPENCPACFEQPKERFRMKRLLAEQEIIFPRLFANLRAAMMPLIHLDTADGLSALCNAKMALHRFSKINGGVNFLTKTTTIQAYPERKAKVETNPRAEDDNKECDNDEMLLKCLSSAI
ncbi:unnamed protein product [Protopolystoma xenopodis]|uniref:Uncharacterized protein n=1 Tax=Protopolystoma xenopodis TaxID=117903 RepID=A0A448XSU0_9PLAT|nr:unnamed protein product [Protopolystoma xenopodis]